MSQQQQQTEHKQTYVPPITCICGGTARLIRRGPHPLKLGSGIEVYTFQCYDCRQITKMIGVP